MATQVDPLRNTLDHLALDPRAHEDRPYLVSMLRRLGYSEVEIRAFLAEHAPEPERPPAPAPTPRRRPAAGPRVVEVEYTGADRASSDAPAGAGAGRPAATPASPQGFTLATEDDSDDDGAFTFALADDDEEQEAGEEELLGDFDASAVDALEGSWDDDWGEGGDFGSAIDKADDPSAVSEEERRQLLEDLGLDPDDPDVVEFGGRPRPQYNVPELAPSRLLEFQEFHPQEAESRVPVDDAAPALEEDAGEDLYEDEPLRDLPPAEGGWQPSDEGTWDPGEEQVEWAGAPESDAGPDLDEGGWEPAEEGPETVTAEVAPGQEGAAAGGGPGFRHEGHTLYARNVDLASGRRQRIYFFAQDPPANAEPVDGMPDGYEVRRHEGTGIPFLRRTGPSSGAEAPRRVRAERVRASSQEEAEQIMRSQGKTVRGAVPVDIEEDEDGQGQQ